MAESQDAILLQRRARRRLVGAIALVVFIVIVFPIVLDNERKPVGQDLVIHIPSQEAGKLNTRLLPAKAPETEPAATAGAAKAEISQNASEAPAKANAKSIAPAAKPEAKLPGEAARSAAAANKTNAGAEGKSRSAPAPDQKGWLVPLGAFTDPKNVKDLQARLSAAGMKSLRETVKGPRGDQTRVRAGPFESKAAAERAREKLKAMGVAAGAPVAPSGSGR